jgi:hypothetical protein
MWTGVETRTIPGPTITLRCPACGRDNARASSYKYGERILLFHLIPVSRYREIDYVKCAECAEQFISDIDVFDLTQYTYNELPHFLKRRIPLVPAFLALTGILLFFFPIVGLLINGVSLLLNARRPHHWARTLSRIGFVLAALVHLLLFILLLVDAIVGLER